jgi:hypothetical protein
MELSSPSDFINLGVFNNNFDFPKSEKLRDTPVAVSNIPEEDLFSPIVISISSLEHDTTVKRTIQLNKILDKPG